MPSRRRVLTAASTGIAGALAGCSNTLGADDDGSSDDPRTTDWPHPHFDAAATGYNPAPIGPTERPDEEWAVEVATPTGRATVAGGTVYVPTRGGLFALAAGSGTVEWRFDPGGENEGSAVAGAAVSTDGDTVYVGRANAAGMAAVNAGTGETRWTRALDDETVQAAPVPTEDGVAVGTSGGRVAFLDGETGDVEWERDVFGGVTHLAASWNLVYAGTTSGEVYALYSSGGLWRRKLPGKITALALAGSSSVVAGTFGGGVFELRGGAHAGRTRWHSDGPTAHRALSVTDEAVVGTDLSNAAALDDRTGEERWSVNGDFGAPPAAAGDTAYLAGEPGVVAVALDGGGLLDGPKRWTYDLPSYAISGVTVARNALFVATNGAEAGPPTVYRLA